MAPHLKRFFIFFYLAAEDLYNEGASGSDGSEYRTLCNFRICLVVGWVRCEDSPIIFIKIKHNVNLILLMKLIRNSNNSN